MCKILYAKYKPGIKNQKDTKLLISTDKYTWHAFSIYEFIQLFFGFFLVNEIDICYPDSKEGIYLPLSLGIDYYNGFFISPQEIYDYLKNTKYALPFPPNDSNTLNFLHNEITENTLREHETIRKNHKEKSLFFRKMIPEFLEFLESKKRSFKEIKDSS